VDVRKISEAYLKQNKVEDGLESRAYMMQLIHREFPEQLNVVVLRKTNHRCPASQPYCKNT